MNSALKIILILAVVGILASRLQSNSGAGAKICPEIAARTEEVIRSGEIIGVVVESSADRLLVEDSRWTQAPHNFKVSLALAQFCINFPKGAGTLLVRGYRDGVLKASVIDGNYSD
jgi:hypothetical protein